MALGNVVRTLILICPLSRKTEALRPHPQDDRVVDYGPHPQTVLQEALRNGNARTRGESSNTRGLEQPREAFVPAERV